MSTTRPLLGMKRITEVTCTEPPGGRQSPTARRTQSEPLTVDEFTVHEDKQAELRCNKPKVEQVFQVTFTIIGLLDHTGAHGSKASRQIWLQLKGKKEDVSKAKEYVKGLCDPELQKEEWYPVDMHCIFAGARGLFLDRLLRDTSAEVQVLEPGRLRLSGCAEAVVMAQSRVQQFVALFQEKRSLPADREPLVKRTFKNFVEDGADKYAMELLLLPSALKEELLGLAQSPTQPIAIIDLEQDRSQTSTPVTDLSNRILDTTFEDKTAGPATTPDVMPGLNGRPCNKRRSSESEQRDTKRQYSLERREEEQLEERQREPSQTWTVTSAKGTLAASESINESEAVSPETNLRCLVNFFRTMGYQQEVVEQVVRETGQTEDTFLLLEQIVEETQKSQGAQHTSRTPDPSPCANTSSTSTCVRLKEKERAQMRALAEIKCKENIRPPSTNGIGQKNQTSSVPLASTTLKRSNGAQNDVCEVIIIDDDDNDFTEIERKPRMAALDLKSESRFDYLPRGSSHTMVPVRMESVTNLRSSSQGPPLRSTDTRPGCSYQTVPGRAPLPRSEAHSTSKPAPLTGISRFQQSLRTPYRLVLQNEPGCPDLRHIIIDGSNVAMAHGLHRIFSCRGIVIAVEAFWRRGHREITVFVPQWRQKKDPNITEQHFLNQLENLRLLSFTPSREVCGQRISSHDDRFLLHLAEKTEGVIVTNDNLRDFVNQSEAWRRIIQERLLQFTFVEDHFMIPDDPLGKNGPHLDEFLLNDRRGSPIMAPPRTDIRATPSVYASAAQSTAHPSSPSHWPHSGPPDWHLPRPSPSPPPQRSPSETTELKRKLYDIFPDQKQRIDRILSDNPYMRDLNALSGLLLG
ncbi:NEDD4-binding protein 1 [Sinocyclocheilus anshuiensis]|uniref:NEDD4-binding protein 1 n=1 Tax=Sinocyclocheilus anshuiensis TaxID=1608454 RepID=A0A671S477_9TELE|nr:PREDICTED: NEDD4-binding protein 1 [Sinocyclocheilus anshuiensis]